MCYKVVALSFIIFYKKGERKNYNLHSLANKSATKMTKYSQKTNLEYILINEVFKNRKRANRIFEQIISLSPFRQVFFCCCYKCHKIPLILSNIVTIKHHKSITKPQMDSFRIYFPFSIFFFISIGQ